MIKTILIDNYDSYTHIIYQYLWKLSGQPPLVIKNDQLSIKELEKLDFENIVISPGPGTVIEPKDIGICVEVLHHFPNKPFLGICLGHQLLGHHFGAEIIQAPSAVHGKYSILTLRPSPLFLDLPHEIEVVRYHSLIVESIPEELEVIGSTKSDGLVMALQHKELPYFGVQFHPESIGTQYGEQIFKNFLKISDQWTQNKSLKDHRPKRFLKKISAPWKNPEEVFSQCFLEHEHAFWLDSSLTGINGRYSFMGAADQWIKLEKGKVLSTNQLPKAKTQAKNPSTFFDYLKETIINEKVESEDPLPFKGGWLGYLAYENHQHLNTKVASNQLQKLKYPESIFLWVENFIAIDHFSQKMFFCSVSENEASFMDWQIQTVEALNQPKAIAKQTIYKDGKNLILNELELQLVQPKTDYLHDIQHIQELIQKGETYEV
ncbi:MAG: gamma-glutamyl-gamma-aminobutyrate hydrolase family protein, partial [Bacteroidota bacterium]